MRSVRPVIHPIHPRTFLGYAKRSLMGYRGKNLSGLLVRIQVILRAIPGERWVEVFLDGMKRLQRCVDMNGEFAGWTKSYQYININAIQWIGMCYAEGGTPCPTFFEIYELFQNNSLFRENWDISKKPEFMKNSHMRIQIFLAQRAMHWRRGQTVGDSIAPTFCLTLPKVWLFASQLPDSHHGLGREELLTFCHSLWESNSRVRFTPRDCGSTRRYFSITFLCTGTLSFARIVSNRIPRHVSEDRNPMAFIFSLWR
jgi:hypothetical protein